MSDHRIAPLADGGRLPAPAGPFNDRRPAAPLSEDTRIAIEIRELAAHGSWDAARERFAELVVLHQRRALRIAYQYLHDAADADEVVQDAFLKVFSHLDSYREAWPFEVWFTRILINGCLDRRKARARRGRWFVSADHGRGVDDTQQLAAHRSHAAGSLSSAQAALDPESRLLARERRARLAAAVDRLDGRQRTIFMLSHYGDCTPREVGAMMGLKESTVRVHLFRAARKLRRVLGGKP
jgi:RNA polymerase sigma-70 factor (ECF subfamily)